MTKIERKNIVNFIFFAIAITLIFVSFYILISAPFKTETRNVRFMVGNEIGIDLNSSELNFGMLERGGNALRNIIVRNDYMFPMKIDILVSGNSAEYMFVDSFFKVNTNESIKIPVKIQLPKDINFGNYSGRIKLEFRKLSDKE